MTSLLTTFAQAMSGSYGYESSSSSVPAIVWLFVIPFAILTIIGMWKTFQKAGKPGWAAIIPVYGDWVLFEIAGMPGWWALLMLVPFINIVGVIMLVIAMFKVAKMFGKSTAFGFLLWLLSPIGFMILGFGKAVYNPNGDGRPSAPVGPGGGASTPAQPMAPTPPQAPAAPQPPTPPTAPTPPTNLVQ